MPINEKSIVLRSLMMPVYRRPFFELIKIYRPNIEIQSGLKTFSRGSLPDPDYTLISKTLNNRMILNKFMWQSGGFKNSLLCDILIISFNTRVLSNWYLLFIRFLFPKKITLLWGHAFGRSSRFSFLRTLMMSLGDGFFCYTNRDIDYLKKKFRRLKTWSLNNSCVHSSDCINRATDSPEVKDILIVSRLVPQKKVFFFLKAFHKALDETNSSIPSDTILHIVGSGPDLDRITNYIYENSLENKCKTYGSIYDINKLNILYKISLFSVCPGYIGLSCIQSFSQGVPMLISRNENHSPEIEACVENVNCMFFDTDDIGSCSSKIQNFFNNKKFWFDRRSEISSNIRETFTYEVMSDSFAEAIQTFL